MGGGGNDGMGGGVEGFGGGDDGPGDWGEGLSGGEGGAGSTQKVEYRELMFRMDTLKSDDAGWMDWAEVPADAA